jgi:cobalt-precorrin-5B (C1)-methyltransferase
VKDAGDDPDVTNGAVIGAELSFIGSKGNSLRGSVPVMLHGGKGVGLVTRPGLPVKKGGPAINPVPRRMIRRAVRETIAEAGESPRSLAAADVAIFVPDGEALAKKTLKPRLWAEFPFSAPRALSSPSPTRPTRKRLTSR